MLGRLLAVDELAKRKDPESVKRLKQLLNEDAFYGVRIAAAQALRSMQTDAAFEALAASAKQKDARVRQEVVSQIGQFYREAALELSKAVLEKEKNPTIEAAAIRSLGAYGKKQVDSILIRELNSDSFHNILGDAAINAMKAQSDPDYINPILACLHEREEKFTTGGFARGLETLAYLAHEQEKKDAVREFLLQNVNSKKERIQVAALNSLGTLGDVKAMAVLEKFAAASKESPQRSAAEKALASLRDSRKSSVELGNLRNEVLSLQKENRDLRKEFDDLKKRIESVLPDAALVSTNKTGGKRKK